MLGRSFVDKEQQTKPNQKERERERERERVAFCRRFSIYVVDYGTCVLLSLDGTTAEGKWIKMVLLDDLKESCKILVVDQKNLLIN